MGKNLVVILTTLVIFATAQAKALGLGEITVDSALNQPLSARIELLDMAGVNPDQITVALASVSDFQRFDIERDFFLENIRFAINTAGGAAQVLLTTDAVVREPYLSFVLETRWPSGRILNEYTVLLDPPAFAAQSDAQSIRPPLPANIGTVLEARNKNPEEPFQNQSVEIDNSSQNLINQPASSADSADVSSAEPAPRFAAAETGTTLTVAEGDTLWDIALQVRPDSTYSVQQTMLALQRLNEEAFIADNINMLRQGRVLRIPDAAQILAITQQQALAEVAQQNLVYSQRRNAPVAAQAVTAPPAANRNAAAGDSGQLIVVTASEPEQQAQNAVDAAAGQAATLETQVRQLENSLAVSNEEMDRVRLENAELTERLNLLEGQISAAQEIIRLRDLELARLQESLQNQPAAVPQETPDTQPTVITMAPEPGITASLLDTLMANTFVLIGAAGLLVLLLVVFLVRRNRQQENVVTAEGIEDDYAGPGAQPDVVLMPRAERSNDYEDDQEDNLDEDETWVREENYAEKFADQLLDDESDESEEHEKIRYPGSEISEEAIEEAEDLVASGQYDEARSVLRNAIVTEPENARLRLKLMEVLVLEGDLLGFQLQETELRSFAEEEDMALLALLKARLPEEEPGQESETNTDNEFENLDAYLSPEEEAELELDLNASAEIDDDKVLEQSATADNPDDEEDFSFDFDLADTSDLDPPGSSDVSTEETAGEAGFDPDDQAMVGQEDDFEKIDFDFSTDDDIDDAEIPRETRAETDVAEESGDRNASSLQASNDESEEDTEFDDLEFALDDLDSELDVVQSDEEEETDMDGFEFLSDTEEAATKLDLARAYIDMGDNEGAREILAEVLTEGTESQISEAQELMERIR